MNKQIFNKRSPILFKHFSRKGYALFSCIGREVLIGTLSISTLTYAKADGISTRTDFASDSLSREEVKLDEVIVTGSRAPLTQLQSAKIVEVITRDDIHRAQATTINDILKLATGVDVRQRGGFGVQTDISINGGTFDQITILLNGVDISNPQTGHNAADFPVSLQDIERIEVLEGASARVFGSQAFNGAINIVTKQSENTGVRISTEAGSFDTWGANGCLSFCNKNFGSTLSGGYQQSDGGTENSDFKKRQLYWQGGLGKEGAKLNWQAGLISKDYGASTFYSARFNNQYETTRRYIASISGELKPIAGSSLTLAPTVYGHRNYDHYQLTRHKTGASNGENYHRLDVYGGSLNIYFSSILGKTAVGADLRREKIYSTAYGDMLDESEYKDIHGSDRKYTRMGKRTTSNFFIEHNVILGGFTLSAGLLANKNTGIDSDYKLYPGIDLSYRPSENLKLFASWNKALRVPTYTDLYTSNSVQQGDLNLKPEKNSTFKVGSQYRSKWLDANLSAFYSKGTDMIDWVYETQESSKYHALNIGELNNMGFSVETTIKLNNLLPTTPLERLKLGYAYIDQDHKTDRQIFKSLYALEYLRHKFTCTLDHRIWRQLHASWSLRWQQRMNGYHPYTKLDGKIMWDANSYNIYVMADNITCHRYYDLGGVKQPGMLVMAGLTIKIQ